MAFELPPLPYAYDALAPHISQETLEFHHDKHHQAYVTKLNEMISGTDDENKSLEEIIMKADGGLFNQAGQTWNHTFYWNSMSPTGGGQPSGEVADKINSAFGSYDSFVEKFKEAATTQFGSGWAWLVLKGDKLAVVSTANQDSPLMGEAISGASGFPIIGLDVWEHAYYLKFQNRRPDYIKAFWDVVNWDEAAARFAAKK